MSKTFFLPVLKLRNKGN